MNRVSRASRAERFESSGTVTSEGVGMFSGERCNYWLPIVWVSVRWNLKYLERISGTVSFSDPVATDEAGII